MLEDGRGLTGHEKLRVGVDIPVHLDTLPSLESGDVGDETLGFWGISGSKTWFNN